MPRVEKQGFMCFDVLWEHLQNTEQVVQAGFSRFPMTVSD